MSVCSKIFKEGGLRQGKVDRLFSALVLPNFSHGLSAYCAEDLDLTSYKIFETGALKEKTHQREWTFETFQGTLSRS